MARKEQCVILLDVGPTMEPHLAASKNAVLSLLLSKLVNKKEHEVAVVLFGTQEAKNALFEEMQGECYHHITVQIDLHVPMISDLVSCEAIKVGNAKADFVDALFVATDILAKAKALREASLPAGSKRQPPEMRIVLVSNLQSEVDALDDEMRDDLVDNLRKLGVKLDVVVLDTELDKPSPHTLQNQNTLDQLCAELQGQHTFRRISLAGEVGGMFKSKEVAPTSMYSGPLTLGPGVELLVKVYKKTARTPAPGLTQFNEQEALDPQEARRNITLSREYREEGADPTVSAPVPMEELVRAYRYGQQVVPITRDDEDAMAYGTERGIWVLGYMLQRSIPRYQYLGESFIIMPDTAHKGSPQAISAFARGMARTGKAAIVRVALRSTLLLGCLTPKLGRGADEVDCLVMNYLPYMEDVRMHQFSVLGHLPGGARVAPTQEQKAAASALVGGMDLGGYPAPAGQVLRPEGLMPEETMNPVLTSLVNFLGRKCINPEQAVPEHVDAAVAATFKPQPTRWPSGAPGAAAALAEAFKDTIRIPLQAETLPEGEAAAKRPRLELGQAADDGGSDAAQQQGAGASSAAGAASSGAAADTGAAAAAARLRVGAVTPLEDFRAMVAAGRLADAVAQGTDMVHALVEGGFDISAYHKAQDLVMAIRRACVAGAYAAAFNQFLTSAAVRYEYSDKTLFWKGLMTAGITLISVDDVRAASPTISEAEIASCFTVPTSKEQADAWLAEHTAAATRPVAAQVVQPAAADADDDDEFADME